MHALRSRSNGQAIYCFAQIAVDSLQVWVFSLFQTSIVWILKQSQYIQTYKCTIHGSMRRACVSSNRLVCQTFERILPCLLSSLRAVCNQTVSTTIKSFSSLFRHLHTTLVSGVSLMLSSGIASMMQYINFVGPINNMRQTIRKKKRNKQI